MKGVRFLSDPATYSVSLPKALQVQPESYGVLTLDGSAREIIYTPASRRQDPEGEPTLTKQFDVSRNGITTSVYSVISSSSPQLVAYWRLPSGYLVYVLGDDTGCGSDLEAGMRLVIEHVDISVDSRGLPSLATNAPVSGGDPKDPFQREELMFPASAQDPAAPVLKLIREPVWKRQGDTVWEGASAAEVSRTTSFGVTVRAFGPTSALPTLRDYADRVASSLIPD